MGFKKFTKKAGAAVVRGSYLAAKGLRKRYVNKRQPKMVNIIKDLAMLKHLVNVEKKRYDLTVASPQAVGQFAGGSSGAYAAIITPPIAEGITGGTRNGLSLKLVSMVMDIKFEQQTSCLNDVKYRWFIVCRPDNGSGVTAATAITQFLEPNTFSGVIDYWANRDAEYFSSFRVIKQGVVDLKQDAITTGNSIIQKKVPLKLNHHLKFNTDAATASTRNQFYLFITASGGESVTALTGGLIVYNCRWYFTDN